jgi:hypothetical protein
MHTNYKMINIKLPLASFIAFAILAMAATTIVTQEAYAKHHAQHAKPKILDLVNVPYDPHKFCGMNYQGNFSLSLGNASLSVPAGMCVPDYSATMGPST